MKALKILYLFTVMTTEMHRMHEKIQSQSSVLCTLSFDPMYQSIKHQESDNDEHKSRMSNHVT